MHIEDDIELVAKNCWDNFEKVKLVFVKLYIQIIIIYKTLWQTILFKL